MNKDIELRLLPKNFYLDAKNVRITSSDAGNSRSVKFALGNTVKSSVAFEGTGATCIGSCVDSFRNLVYWAVATSTHSYILEYNVGTEGVRTIVDDINSTGVFNFTTDMYVEMRVLNDNDNGKNYLIITDGVNEPKYFEIDTVQAMAVDSYVDLDVELIKRPPTSAPTLVLGAAASSNMETKFLSFAYRYKYQNGEYSALSPFSEFAFEPSNSFEYNYKDGTNTGMFNSKSSVAITMNTGASQVTDLQLIVKESGSNTAYIVETYNKSDEGWGDNTTQSVDFNNSRIYQALDANQLSRVFDNVPRNAYTLELIGNRLVFGNYTEGYDIEYLGTPIDIDLSLSYISTAGTAGNWHKQVKTNRDYEIAIAYIDGKGRMTTPLTSDGNTTYIPYSVANQKNQLQVTINRNQRPPDWATGYRFFIKQSKIDYDVIAPITFYRDGVYAWVKLEGSDVQKVAEGDFLFVKSDTSGLKSTTIRTKVLEIKVQEENFLEGTPPDPYQVLQEAGTYMRLQVDDYALSEEAVTVYEYTSYSFRSKSTNNNMNNGSATNNSEQWFDGAGLDDLTVNLASFTGGASSDHDYRIEVEITASGSPDTYQYTVWNITDNDTADAAVTGQSVSTSLTTLTGTDGVRISFGATTGHTVGDKWLINVRSTNRPDLWNNNPSGSVSAIGRCAIVSMKSKTPPDEGIKAGAVITLTYDDTASDSGVDNQAGFVNMSFSSSKDYPNLEEWFWGELIYNNADFQSVMKNGDFNNWMFRRGTISSNLENMTVTDNVNDELILNFLSVANYTGGARIRIDGELTVTEFDNNIILETIPVDTSTDIFYELPYTYTVSGGVHLGKGGDTSQSFGVTDAVITLDYFNSFGGYNGFESYKIGDTFNENTMVLDTKPLVPIDNYQEITRIASMTYSDTYESTTQFNALNEFNLAEVNYKDMDIRYGAIRKLHARDTDLVVFQHDKTHRVLFQKSVLFNADGSGNVSQNLNVLGQEVAYAGEYGIGEHPESFAFFGNRIYHLDKDRGALMRLSVDGYTEISQQGFYDYFRSLPDQTNFVGGYDLYNDEYLLNVVPDASPLTLAFAEQIGFTSFYEFEPERMVGINNKLFSMKDGQIWQHDTNTTRNNFYGVQRNANITTVFNDAPSDVKHFKSVNLETDVVWDITLTTNFGTSTIADTELVLEEKEYYAYIRQNESSTFADLVADSAVSGIGTIASISVLTLTMNGELPRPLAIGDTIYNDSGTAIGAVTAYDHTANTITLDSVAGLSVSDFILFGKTARIEGESMKGYYMTVQLDSSSTADNELFAVKVEAVRSFD
jgi:hypothetical protein